jgi:mannose-6-phosphate isomerase-like protein (cupin superfamily)
MPGRSSTGEITVSGKENLWFGNTLATIHLSSGEGADGICVMEHRLPFDDAPPLHVHHDEDEVFHILEGRMRFVLGGRTIEAGAGETVLAPKGVPHTFRIISAEGARVMVITRGDGFENLVRGAGRWADEPRLPNPETPTPEVLDWLSMVAAENGIAILGPPAV